MEQFKNYQEIFTKIEEVLKKIKEKKIKIKDLEYRKNNYYARNGEEIDENEINREIEELKQETDNLQAEYSDLFIQFKKFRHNDADKVLPKHEWESILDKFVTMQIKVEGTSDVRFAAQFGVTDSDFFNALDENYDMLKQKYQELSHAIDERDQDLYYIISKEIGYYQRQLNSHHRGAENLNQLLSTDEIKEIFQKDRAYRKILFQEQQANEAAEKEMAKGVRSDNPYVRYMYLQRARNEVLHAILAMRKSDEALSDEEFENKYGFNYSRILPTVYYETLNNPDSALHSDLSNIVNAIDELRHRFPKIASEIPFNPRYGGLVVSHSGDLWSNAVQYESDRLLSKETEHEQKPNSLFKGFEELRFDEMSSVGMVQETLVEIYQKNKEKIDNNPEVKEAFEAMKKNYSYLLKTYNGNLKNISEQDRKVIEDLYKIFVERLYRGAKQAFDEFHAGKIVDIGNIETSNKDVFKNIK